MAASVAAACDDGYKTDDVFIKELIDKVCGVEEPAWRASQDPYSSLPCGAEGERSSTPYVHGADTLLVAPETVVLHGDTGLPEKGVSVASDRPLEGMAHGGAGDSGGCCGGGGDAGVDLSLLTGSKMPAPTSDGLNPATYMAAEIRKSSVADTPVFSALAQFLQYCEDIVAWELGPRNGVAFVFRFYHSKPEVRAPLMAAYNALLSAASACHHGFVLMPVVEDSSAGPSDDCNLMCHLTSIERITFNAWAKEVGCEILRSKTEMMEADAVAAAHVLAAKCV